MMDLVVSRRQDSKSSRTRAVRPVVEGLEDRMLLYAVTGDHFVYGSRITWSIVPDGTNLGGVTSNLVSTLNQKFGAGNWIPAIDDAFAQWETYANVNLVGVSDDGEPIGAGPDQQGNPNFGDIRIGGYAQAQNILAYTLLPPAANGSSDAGDLFFNTSLNWNIGSDYDLETVALHEIGHALGLGHSADVNAAMYPYYGGVQQSPNTDDIAGIRSIWGPRAEDGLAVGNSNFTSAKAASITPFINGANDQIVLPNQDVASTAESYWFKVTTPSNASNNLTVQVQSTSLSELSPKVQIYNANLQGLVQTSATTNAYGALIDASISNATPNTVYYIRVLGSNGGSTGTGAYGMTVNMGSSAIGLISPPNTTVADQPDQGSGSVYEHIGGANTAKNTPVDVPDKIKLGNITANGDYLVIQPKQTHKHLATHIKAPHPSIDRGFVSPKKVKSHR